MENSLAVKLYHYNGSFVTENLAYKILDSNDLDGSTVEIEMPTTKFNTDGWKDDVYFALKNCLWRINAILYVTKLNP